MSIRLFSFSGKVASNSATAASSSQQSAAMEGMYIHLIQAGAYMVYYIIRMRITQSSIAQNVKKTETSDFRSTESIIFITQCSRIAVFYRLCSILRGLSACLHSDISTKDFLWNTLSRKRIELTSLTTINFSVFRRTLPCKVLLNCGKAQQNPQKIYSP